MKIATGFFLLFAVLFSCDSNTPEEPATDVVDESTPLPDGFKGYELYSWEAGGQWKFTLITGTNRNKTYDEIVSKTNVVDGDWVKITVTGTESLKQLLQRLSAPEDISWVNTPIRVSGFSLPSTTVIAEIEDHCKRHDLALVVIR
jgi:hypothetical protein